MSELRAGEAATPIRGSIRPMLGSRLPHALLLTAVLVAAASIASAAASARSATPSAARTALAATSAVGPTTCPPLPPPEGFIVRVDSVAELEIAVRGLVDDMTILIAPGDYPLTQTLYIDRVVRGARIRGEGDDPSAIVIRGPGMTQRGGGVAHGFLVGPVEDFEIANLTIRDVPYHAIQLQGENDPRDVRLTHLRLINAGEQFIKVSTAGPSRGTADGGEVACSWIGYEDRAPSDYTNGFDILAGADWLVRDNSFVNIRAPAGQLAGPAVLAWRATHDTVVERNVFLNCDRAIALGLSSPSPTHGRDGDTTYDHVGGIIRNNLVWRDADSITGDIGITVNFARDVRIEHNTVIQNDTFPFGAIEYRFGVTNAVIRNNLSDAPIWRRDDATAELAGNVTDAQANWFVDADAGDLHLRASATGAIDRAVAGGAGAVDPGSAATVADDVDGEARPWGEAADVGADEWRPGGTPAVGPTRDPNATATVTASPVAASTTRSVGTATPTSPATRSPGGTATSTPEVTSTTEPGPLLIYLSWTKR
jgi:hypothetical protein